MTVHERLRPGKYKLSVEDFLRLDQAGIFADARTELLGGEIIIMNSEYRPHAWIKGELGYRLRQALKEIGSDLHAMDASVRSSDHDLPLPDVVLTREPRGEGPIPLASVALVVEVSSTTLRRDMGRKMRLYATAGIPEYWVVDVNARTMHQLWVPTGGGYRERLDVAFGEPIASQTVHGLLIATDEL